MARLILLIAGLFCVSGCSTLNKIEGIAILTETERAEWMNKENIRRFETGVAPKFPSAPYSRVDHLTINVTEGKWAGRNVTFFLGESRVTGKWEVFAAMVQENAEWKWLPVKSPKIVEGKKDLPTRE